jgi:hypothetical protein
MMREARNRPLGRTLLAGLSALALGLACRPVTTRPPFPPVPEATSTEIRLPPAEAARLLGEAFRAESIPATRVELRDTWLETGWFSASTGQPVRHHRPTGSDIVRVRAWADVTHPGYCKVSVETVYRPLADPSLPQRELDRQVARDHPVAIKVRATLQDLVKRYGGPPQPAQTPTAAPEGEPGNEPQPEQPEEPSDTTTDQSR